jgi:hypothetical protein
LKRLIVADSIRTPTGSSATGLLIDGGHVIEVGDARSLRSEDTLEVHYPAAVVIPGLRDAHLHPLGLASPGLDLGDIADITELRALIAQTEGTIIGSGLDEHTLSDGRLPTRHDLDDIDRPVLLYRVCGHIAIANTAALEAAGLDPATPDPVGGAIDRDHGGAPTGILRETAISLVASRLETAPVEPGRLLAVLQHLSTLGITSIGAVVTSAWSERIEPLIDLAGDLPLRVHAIVEALDQPTIRALDHSLLMFGGVKAFADGSFGGRTAALREPYNDDPTTAGVLRLDRADVISRARVALDAGGIVAVHAIGDLAIDKVLDCFEELIDEGASPRSLRVEHASIADDEQLGRMADLGVTACVQPAFVPSDGPWLSRRLGSDRASLVYRFAAMHRAGIPTSGGSDAPVESPDPFAGMAAARDRGGFHLEESLSAEQAFALFTASAAESLGEQVPLSSGAPADFTVVDRDPVLASPDSLRRTRVVATWVAGSEIYHS